MSPPWGGLCSNEKWGKKVESVTHLHPEVVRLPPLHVNDWHEEVVDPPDDAAVHRGVARNGAVPF